MTDTRVYFAGEGSYKIMLRMWDTARGWTGSLTGGDSPHVGGVILATPRPRTSGGGLTCDLYVVPVHGHKDTEGAMASAKRLCVNLNVPIVLTCGIHKDKASGDDIRLILANCDEVVTRFLEDVAPSR
ncbi:MAG: hypothetical protein LBH56_00655 [Coriobacteriales bacterium]|nr:hypothetical protein [Coriobacteriales bacterium]